MKALEIACPAAPGEPLHLASYDPSSEVLTCERCGVLPSEEVVAALEREWADFARRNAWATSRALEADERDLARVARIAFRALRAESALALELVLGFAARTLGGRLPEASVLAIAEAVLDAEAAA